ncbi:transmembrane domain-containing protein [Cryptosporidium parvum]
MDMSDFVFKDGGKRPIVKTIPGGGTSGSPTSPGSPIFGAGTSGGGSRAPMPKFSGGSGSSPRSSITPLSPQRSSSFKRNSSLSGSNLGVDSKANNLFGMNKPMKVSPKNQNGSKYSTKNSFPIITKAKQTPGGSTENKYNTSNATPTPLLVKKISTDKEVNSAQPSPRKSLRLQPDYNKDEDLNERRHPTNDELRLFSVPPASSDERKNVPKKFQSRGRDLTESEFPHSNKPGEKRTSTSLYSKAGGAVLGGTEVINGMEVIMPSDEVQERKIGNDQFSNQHKNSLNRGDSFSGNKVVVDIPNPNDTRPRNSILNTKIVPKHNKNSAPVILPVPVPVPASAQTPVPTPAPAPAPAPNSIQTRLSSNGNISKSSGMNNLRRSISKKKGFTTIVEAMVNIEPEENDENNGNQGAISGLGVPIVLGNNNNLLGPDGLTIPTTNHRVSESQVVNYDEELANEGKAVGRTSVQMVKMGEIQNQQQKLKSSTSLEHGNTFKLDEHGLTGHLKWLYGEETQIDIAVGPYAKELPLDAIKVDKSYHVSELDPISQTKIASKFRKWVNPIHGRIFVVLTTSFALVGVFFQSLIYNRLNKWDNGNCGGVYVESFSMNSMLGPCSKTLSALGGLVVNELRQGEMIRMFWAMWMHTGFIHIGFNVISQAQLGYMIEPDWGILRFFLLFFLSGVGGNLAVAVISPCSLTVGSSGGLFGITAASIPYTFENWNNLPAPMFMFIFSLFSLIIGMILSFTGVTNPWAHIGGFVVGILYTFATMKACKGCSPEDRLDRYNRMAALPLFRLFMKQDKEWINRQLEEKKIRKIEKRNAKIAEQWRKNQRIKKNALIKQMKIEQIQGEITDSLGLIVDENGIKRRTDLTILIDRIPTEKIPIKNKIKIYFKNRIKSLREKKLLWTFRILSGILLLFYFVIGWLGTFYPPLYWPNPIGVISFSDGATSCGCCYVNDVYTCGSNPEFIKWCESKGSSAQPKRTVFGYDFS